MPPLTRPEHYAPGDIVVARMPGWDSIVRASVLVATDDITVLYCPDNADHPVYGNDLNLATVWAAKTDDLAPLASERIPPNDRLVPPSMKLARRNGSLRNKKPIAR